MHRDEAIDATTVDVSANGVGLTFFGSLAIPDGDEIDLNINSSYAKARVSWTRNNGELAITTVGCEIQSGSLNI